VFGAESRTSIGAIGWLLLAVPREKILLAVMLDFSAEFSTFFEMVVRGLAVIE